MLLSSRMMRSPLEKVRKEEPSPAAVVRVKIQETWIFKKGDERRLLFSIYVTQMIKLIIVIVIKWTQGGKMPQTVIWK